MAKPIQYCKVKIKIKKKKRERHDEVSIYKQDLVTELKLFTFISSGMTEMPERPALLKF